ncbi:hypothetical protein [Mycolicibacterium sarraceniae]|uniref:hypothetical protein n=1 Tax=Mycolicibacterium sarraceniae TaxID=1534348 RepID=UPI0013D5F8F9|nr:hypothetical protein [Mycolicibacterium sarraceniae]
MILGGFLDLAVETVAFFLPALQRFTLFGRRVGRLASEQPVQALLRSFVGRIDPPIVPRRVRRLAAASPTGRSRSGQQGVLASTIGPK